MERWQDGVGNVVGRVESQRRIGQQGGGTTNQLDEGESWSTINDDVRHSLPCPGLFSGVDARPLSCGKETQVRKNSFEIGKTKSLWLTRHKLVSKVHKPGKVEGRNTSARAISSGTSVLFGKCEVLKGGSALHHLQKLSLHILLHR